MSVPPLDVPGCSSALAAKEEAGPVPRGAFGNAALVEGISDPKEISAPTSLPDEMMETLKCVPCFIDGERPSIERSKTVEVVFSHTLPPFLI